MVPSGTYQVDVIFTYTFIKEIEGEGLLAANLTMWSIRGNFLVRSRTQFKCILDWNNLHFLLLLSYS